MQPEPAPRPRAVRLTRHGDHDPTLICRPAFGYGLCEIWEVKYGDEEDEGGDDAA